MFTHALVFSDFDENLGSGDLRPLDPFGVYTSAASSTDSKWWFFVLNLVIYLNGAKDSIDYWSTEL